MRADERKARGLVAERSGGVLCACLCGQIIEANGSRGRTRRFAYRHYLAPHIRDVVLRLEEVDSDRDDVCWEWPGGVNNRGYGVTKRNGENYAHRSAWVQVMGDIPDGMDVLHRCDNPPCYRPKHLFLGTAGDNVADMISKGRSNYRLGADTPNFRVPDDVVAQIRQRRAEGVSMRKVAREFGVYSSYVHWVTKGGGRP